MTESFRAKGVGGGKKKKFKFRNKLLSLDASVITLCLKLFPWAKYRTTKGGVKLHVLLDHDDYMPEFVHITNANKSDVTSLLQGPKVVPLTTLFQLKHLIKMKIDCLIKL